MPTLSDYDHFAGRHAETGSVHNVLAYQGVRALHTGRPYTEAFLLGVSGGIAFGYFTFDYRGYDPILALLTRNTFDPLQTMLERLGVPQTVRQTGSPDAGERNLREALASGVPALVWADRFSLPYNALPHDERNWDVQPVVVFGLDDSHAYLADRSSSPLRVPVEALRAARQRVKKDKFRVVTLGPPDERKLAEAARQGIRDCLRLFREPPPKGARDNFGFAAFEKWARMLTNTRNPQGWSRYFPPGRRMLAALAGGAYQPGAYGWIAHWGTGPQADRETYADFLEEAALLLDRPALREPASRFRESAGLWRALAEALLPAELPLLGEARRLKDRRERLFIEQGGAAADEIGEINARLEALPELAERDFPLSEAEAAGFRAELQGRVQAVLEAERRAVDALSDGLG